MLAHFEQNDVVAALPEDTAESDGAPVRREFHSLLQIPVPSADPDRPLHVLQVYASDAEQAEWVAAQASFAQIWVDFVGKGDICTFQSPKQHSLGIL